MVLAACILFACEPNPVVEKPNVVSFPVVEITETSAKTGGNVISDGGAEVTSRGMCWSINQNPTIEEDNKTVDGAGTGEFISNINELTDSTTYYIRAYAVNSVGVSYGEEYRFVTLKLEDEGNDDEEGDGDNNGGDDENEEDDDNNGDDDEVVIELPELVTLSVTQITETTAMSGGNITTDGGAEVTTKGVCWSTNQNPTIEDSYVINGNGVGEYVSYITGLTMNTTYYVRAYATNSKGTAYGEEISFTTLKSEDVSGSINGHEYVDLGLPSGLKWATCNIGADSPSASGDYIAWGELEPKDEYTEANNTTYNLPLTQISADINYDAAAVRWGETWRIPTREEMEELRDECSWEWMTDGETPGFKVTGSNGKHIFLPASGFVFVTTPYFVEQYGYYWTSVSGTDNYLGAFSMCFASETIDVAWYFRYAGLTIRPVSN